MLKDIVQSGTILPTGRLSSLLDGLRLTRCITPDQHIHYVLPDRYNISATCYSFQEKRQAIWQFILRPERAFYFAGRSSHISSIQYLNSVVKIGSRITGSSYCTFFRVLISFSEALPIIEEITKPLQGLPVGRELIDAFVKRSLSISRAPHALQCASLIPSEDFTIKSLLKRGVRQGQYPLWLAAAIVKIEQQAERHYI